MSVLDELIAYHEQQRDNNKLSSIRHGDKIYLEKHAKDLDLQYFQVMSNSLERSFSLNAMHYMTQFIRHDRFVRHLTALRDGGPNATY